MHDLGNCDRIEPVSVAQEELQITYSLQLKDALIARLEANWMLSCKNATHKTIALQNKKLHRLLHMFRDVNEAVAHYTLLAYVSSTQDSNSGSTSRK